MTAQEIADRALSRELTPERVQKLKALCVRAKVPLERVLVLLPEAERAKVEG